MASGFMIKLTVAIMGSIIFLLLKCKLMTLPLPVIIPPHFLSLFSHSSKLDTTEIQFINCVLIELEICEYGYKDYR